MSDSKLLRGRTLARCQALQILFQAEACGRSVDDVLASDFVFNISELDENNEPLAVNNKLANGSVLSASPLDSYAKELAQGVAAHMDELDSILEGAAQNWSLSRMSATDRNLLRMALFEIKYVDEVDSSVSISECVELAKAFGSSDESSRFVNGILGHVVRESA